MTVPTTPPPDQAPGRVSPTKPLESDRPEPGSSFQSYMQPAASSAPSAIPSTTTAPSPMQLAQGGAPAQGPASMTTLMGQARSAQDTLGTVAQQLGLPNLKMKRSQAHLLRNKLTDANTHLRVATQKLGLEPAAPQVPPGLSTVGRFLSYVGEGQDMLVQVQDKLKELSASPQGLSPSDMLLIQIKLGQAQQEIEYSATLTSKMVDSIKTLLSIQL